VEPGEPPLDIERRERTIVSLKRIDGLGRLLARKVINTSLLEPSRNLNGMIGCERIRGCETGNSSADFLERLQWHRLANAGQNAIV
jgi:hypothetical protein